MARPPATPPPQRCDADMQARARISVQAARVLAIERFPYLDSALSGLTLVSRPGLGTVAVDARWRFYYDPLRVLEQTSGGSVDAIVSDWVHEVMHVLRDHHGRWRDLREPPQAQPTWNSAADAHVNADLAELGLLILPTDVTFERLAPIAAVHRGQTTEEVYRILRGSPGRTGDVVRGQDRPRDCGSAVGGARRPWEEQLDDDRAGGASDGSVDADRAEGIREDSARKVLLHAQGRGRDGVPRGLLEWAHDWLDPSVDWRRELRSSVSRALGQACGRTDYSFLRPARRRAPGFTLPGMVGTAPPPVAVVVDTSGSMGDDDLQLCLAELIGLVRALAGAGARIRVPVLACTTSVRQVVRVGTAREIQRVALPSGGGTDLRAGIEAAARVRPTPGVIVVLTDGATPWPSARPAAAPAARYVVVLVRRPRQTGVRVAVPAWMHVIEATASGDAVTAAT